jgi:hypothetical protein
MAIGNSLLPSSHNLSDDIQFLFPPCFATLSHQTQFFQTHQSFATHTATMSDNRKPDKPGKDKEPARPTASVSDMPCSFANQYFVLTRSAEPFHTRVQTRSHSPFSVRVAFGDYYSFSCTSSMLFILPCTLDANNHRNSLPPPPQSGPLLVHLLSLPQPRAVWRLSDRLRALFVVANVLRGR